MKRTPLVIVAGIAAVAIVLAGISFDRKRVRQRQRAEKAPVVAVARPPLPQWGALLPEGDNVEVSGSAMCGYCTWRVGEPPDNLVLQMNTEPGIVFVVGNEKRTEIERLTGACAGGEYWVTARGSVSQYNGHNYLLVKNFDAVKTK